MANLPPRDVEGSDPGRNVPPRDLDPEAPFRTKGHPRGLYLLFVTEMWERFSYYGMRALLFLYMTRAAAEGGLGWTEEMSGKLYGWYTGLVYLTPIAGGYLADRYLGTHRSMVIGGIIIALGHFTLAIESTASFYTGLAFIIVGTGFFKPCVSIMVGQLYERHDARRDAAFTIFYMGVNLGAFLGPIACGWLRVRYGWNWGFGAAGVGMILGLIVYFIGRPHLLKGIGLAPRHQQMSPERKAELGKPLTFQDKQRIAVIFIMAFFVIFFWTGFELAGTSMNIFAEEHTDRSLPKAMASWGDDAGNAPAEWFQSVNPLFILLLAPLFAMLWTRLGRIGRQPSTPIKFGFGLILLGLGFIFMVLGARSSEAGDTIVRVSSWYLIGAYFLHTCGELCLSPVGLSMVSRLAPVKFASLMMGCWYLANFAANKLSGNLGGSVDNIAQHSWTIGGLTLSGQAFFYAIFVAAPIVAGLVVLLLAPILRRMMHGLS